MCIPLLVARWKWLQKCYCTKNFHVITSVTSRLLPLPAVCMEDTDLCANTYQLLSSSEPFYEKVACFMKATGDCSNLQSWKITFSLVTCGFQGFTEQTKAQLLKLHVWIMSNVLTWNLILSLQIHAVHISHTLKMLQVKFFTAWVILGHLDFSLTLFLCSNYNKLMTCVEDWAKKTRCWGYGFLVDEIYLEVHQTYFSLCGYVRDPPLFTLIMLIAPCIIVTLFLPLLCVHIAPRDT